MEIVKYMQKQHMIWGRNNETFFISDTVYIIAVKIIKMGIILLSTIDFTILILYQI